MNQIDINLCNELIAEMKKLDFNDISINRISNDIRFIDAIDKPTVLQKTILTMVLFGILVDNMKDTIIPSNIRVALNIAPSIEGWFEDIKLVILPFLKVNESTFFPSHIH